MFAALCFVFAVSAVSAQDQIELPVYGVDYATSTEANKPRLVPVSLKNDNKDYHRIPELVETPAPPVEQTPTPLVVATPTPTPSASPVVQPIPAPSAVVERTPAKAVATVPATVPLSPPKFDQERRQVQKRTRLFDYVKVADLTDSDNTTSSLSLHSNDSTSLWELRPRQEGLVASAGMGNIPTSRLRGSMNTPRVDAYELNLLNALTRQVEELLRVVRGSTLMSSRSGTAEEEYVAASMYSAPSRNLWQWKDLWDFNAGSIWDTEDSEAY